MCSSALLVCRLCHCCRRQLRQVEAGPVPVPRPGRAAEAVLRPRRGGATCEMVRQRRLRPVAGRRRPLLDAVAGRQRQGRRVGAVWQGGACESRLFSPYAWSAENGEGGTSSWTPHRRGVVAAASARRSISLAVDGECFSPFVVAAVTVRRTKTCWTSSPSFPTSRVTTARSSTQSSRGLRRPSRRHGP